LKALEAHEEFKNVDDIDYDKNIGKIPEKF